MINIKKILIAIDDDPASEKVALNGYQLGKQLNAAIALVSILDPVIFAADGVVPNELTDILKKDYFKTQQIIIDKIFKDCKALTFIKEGKTFDEILNVAGDWEADLIVLGTHHRTGLSKLLEGSVAEKVIRHSTKPLLIIPLS